MLGDLRLQAIQFLPCLALLGEVRSLYFIQWPNPMGWYLMWLECTATLPSQRRWIE